MPAKSLQELFVEELRDALRRGEAADEGAPEDGEGGRSPTELRAAVYESSARNRAADSTTRAGLPDGWRARAWKEMRRADGDYRRSWSAMEELRVRCSTRRSSRRAAGRALRDRRVRTLALLRGTARQPTREGPAGTDASTEEKAADETLTTIAKSSVNRNALIGAGTEDEEESSMPRAARRGARRMVASGRGSRGSGTRAVAHDRSRGGVRGNAGGRRRSSQPGSIGSIGSEGSEAQRCGGGAPLALGSTDSTDTL